MKPKTYRKAKSGDTWCCECRYYCNPDTYHKFGRCMRDHNWGMVGKNGTCDFALKEKR